jgi:pSer/pThr/pTyr-binding forkhead associated (FHA) protein
MKAKLIERGADVEHTREVPITQPQFLIGRAADCDLRLRVSSISRHHCLIRLGPDVVTVDDLGSSNGTFLNGQRIRSQAELHSGDELQVGTVTFLVDLGDLDRMDLGLTANVDSRVATIRLPRGPKVPKASGKDSTPEDKGGSETTKKS